MSDDFSEILAGAQREIVNLTQLANDKYYRQAAVYAANLAKNFSRLAVWFDIQAEHRETRTEKISGDSHD